MTIGLTKRDTDAAEDTRMLTATRDNALREVTSIGAGHAATSLSQLTGLAIMIDVPRVYITPLEDFAQSLSWVADEWTTVGLPVLGDVYGHTYLILDSASAKRLACRLLGRQCESGPPLDELERSGLCETGNILASSFVNALSRLLGMTLMLAHPSLSVGPEPGAGTALTDPSQSARAVCAQTDLKVGPSLEAKDDAPRNLDETIHAVFLFVPANQALGTIFDRLQVT